MAASAAHGAPAEGATCMCCWDDVSLENYVEYKFESSSNWLPSGFCKECINEMLKTQWELYRKRLETVNCKAEQRRLLERGPPINISDKTALPCPDTEEVKEVYMLWFACDGQEHCAKLVGSLTGEERLKYWNEQKEFYFPDEPEDK